MKQVSVVAIATALCAAVVAASAQGASTMGVSPGFSICDPVAGVSLLAGGAGTRSRPVAAAVHASPTWASCMMTCPPRPRAAQGPTLR